jgi:hypothetical protein
MAMQRSAASCEPLAAGWLPLQRCSCMMCDLAQSAKRQCINYE